MTPDDLHDLYKCVGVEMYNQLEAKHCIVVDCDNHQEPKP